VVVEGVGNGNMTEAPLNTLAEQAKSGIACVRASRVTTGRVGRNVEVDEDKFGFVAAVRLNPQRPACCFARRC
jgi:L-asparaginase